MLKPPLPVGKENTILKALTPESLPPVKYQVLSCQGQEILVGRMKIPTQAGSGHAFVLRRYDTGAISATTMFRAAFPDATDVEEKKQTLWIKDHYDVSKNNGSSRDQSIVRLAGTWLSSDDARSIAKFYNLNIIIDLMSSAEPDPSVNYRRSGKGSPSSPPPSQLQSAPVTPTPGKRRKESAVQPATSTPQSVKAQPASLAPPRRSTRTKSNSPAPPTSPPRKSTRTKGGKSSRSLALQDSDETAVDEDAEAAARMGEDMLKEDVEEQQALIADLKAQRDSEMDGYQGKASKRNRAIAEQEFPTKLNIQEPETGERAIAGSSRASRFRLATQPKSFALGVAALAIGFGAVTLWPNLANISMSSLSSLANNLG